MTEPKPISGGQQAVGPSKTALAKEVIAEERAKEERLIREENEDRYHYGTLAPLAQQARRTNAAAWEAAQKATPKELQNLVDDLAAKPEPTSVEESAMLLRHRIELRNQVEKHVAEMTDMSKSKADRDAAAAKANKLYEQIDLADQLASQSGSELGRALQFQKQMALYDFSLAGMLGKARAAKQAPLSREETAQVAADQKQIADQQTKLDAAEAAKNASGQGIDGQATAAYVQADVATQKAKQKFLTRIEGWKWDNLSPSEKAADLWKRFNLFQLFTAPTALGKIASSAATQHVVMPLKEMVGSVARQLPGFRTVARKATIEGRGFDPAIERAVNKSFAQGWADLWQTLLTGKSDLDIRFGKGKDGDAVNRPLTEGKSDVDIRFGKGKNGDAVNRPLTWLDWINRHLTWLDWIGRLHAAVKATAVRASYERTYRQIEASYREAGKDWTSAAAEREIGQQAYDNAQRVKFQEDNAAHTAWRKAINSLKSPEASGAARAAAVAGETLLPITRTPTNVVLQAFEHFLGVPLAAARTGLAALSKQGLAGLKEAEANGIMRQMKAGVPGFALLMAGYFLGDKLVGGLYSGKRKDQELKPGEIDTPLGVLPSWVTAHHPALMALHLGAALKREDQRRQGMGSYAHAIGSLGEEVPFIREGADLPALVSGDRRAWGGLARRIAVPGSGLISWIARQTDEAPHRYPQSILEEVKAGVPGLRQQIQTKPARPRRTTGTYP